MSTKEKSCPPAVLVSLDWIASRWSVSRTTVRRIVEAADVKPFFLSGVARGVRRYRRSDIEQIEDQARAP